MDISQVAHIAGGTITAGLGLMGLVRPSAAAALTSIKPVGKTGVSEIRATYGGLFLALGAFVLWSQDPMVLRTAGLAWMGIACGRLVSIVVDKNREAANIGAFVMEAVVGALLLAP